MAWWLSTIEQDIGHGLFGGMDAEGAELGKIGQTSFAPCPDNCFGGMWANNRRMVWVQIGMAFITLYLATPMNATKYKIRKFVWAMTPLLILYVMIGWNHPTGIFSPVKPIRAARSSPRALMRSPYQAGTKSSVSGSAYWIRARLTWTSK